MFQAEIVFLFYHVLSWLQPWNIFKLKLPVNQSFVAKFSHAWKVRTFSLFAISISCQKQFLDIILGFDYICTSWRSKFSQHKWSIRQTTSQIFILFIFWGSGGWFIEGLSQTIPQTWYVVRVCRPEAKKNRPKTWYKSKKLLGFMH